MFKSKLNAQTRVSIHLNVYIVHGIVGEDSIFMKEVGLFFAIFRPFLGKRSDRNLTLSDLNTSSYGHMAVLMLGNVP